MQYRADEKIRFFSSLLVHFAAGLHHDLSAVMPGLVPGIHVLLGKKKDVDGRDKPGHDGL
jgi:hypothetical protein